MWAVKVGSRYKAAFMGDDAKERALARGAEFREPDVIERPEPKRTARKPHQG